MTERKITLPLLPMTPHRFHINVTQLGEKMNYTATDVEQYARAAIAPYKARIAELEKYQREAVHLRNVVASAADDLNKAEAERDALAIQLKMRPSPMADCPVYCKTAVDLQAERDELSDLNQQRISELSKALEENAKLRELLAEMRPFVNDHPGPLAGKLLERIDAALREHLEKR